MMMFPFWARIILARWSKSAAHLFSALLLSGALANAAAPAPAKHAAKTKTSRAKRPAAKSAPVRAKKPAKEKPAPRAAPAARAASSVKTRAATPAPGALNSLKLGIAAFDAGQYPAAVSHLRAAAPKLPKLRDYIAYWTALSLAGSRDYSGAIKELDEIWNSPVASPHEGSAAMVAARAYRETGAAAQAVSILREHHAKLPQPSGDLLLASCYDLASDATSAAAYYQRVYFGYPNSPEAAQASTELMRLKTALGPSYPPATAQMMLQRAERWSAAGYDSRARAEYESIIPQVAGADREIARVRIGAADYNAFQTASAVSYLRSLELSSPQSDAERLYYLAEAARRLDKEDEMLRTVNRLAELYPKSPWSLKALVSAGNRFLVQNRPDIYEPLYRAAAEGFGNESQAAYSHWKCVWLAYLKRSPETAEMMRTHIIRYPGSEKASSALYFLGRMSESAGEPASAKAYYQELVDRFPNYFYGYLAEERLASPDLFRAVPSTAVALFLKTVVWPIARNPGKFEPTATTRTRLDRAELLYAAGLDSYAETELRYGARTDGQRHLLAMALAQHVSRGGSVHQAMRWMKNMAPGYLTFPLDSAPAAFWRLLYPLPYRRELESNAKARGLDPFVIAGLIRQESEFNPQAVSPANAYGLTQVVPSTGRQLMRKLGQRRFRPAMLFRPDINLRLGTMYLRELYDRYGAAWEPTLAAYNAGGSRVQNWSNWGQFKEPAEFVETIPFTETRNYVFSVLRNAQIYRQLYGSEAAATLEPLELTPRTAAAASKAKKGAGFKRAPVVKKRRAAKRR